MPEEKKKPVNKMLVAIIVLLVFLVCIGVVIVVMLSSKSNTKSNENLVEISDDGTLVSLQMDTHLVLDEEDLPSEQELQRRIEEGRINVKFGDTIFVKNGKEGTCDIANSSANTKDIFVSLWLDDTKEEIYRSGVIPVGSKIQQLELNRSLEIGDYSGILVYNQLEDNKVVGQVNVAVTFKVQS